MGAAVRRLAVTCGSDLRRGPQYAVDAGRGSFAAAGRASAPSQRCSFWGGACAAELDAAAGTHSSKSRQCRGPCRRDQKWQLKNRALTLDRYVRLTGRAWGAELIVWEPSLPALSVELGDYLQALKELGRAHGADFAIGLDDYWPKTKQYFNGIRILSDR